MADMGGNMSGGAGWDSWPNSDSSKRKRFPGRPGGALSSPATPCCPSSPVTPSCGAPPSLPLLSSASTYTGCLSTILPLRPLRSTATSAALTSKSELRDRLLSLPASGGWPRLLAEPPWPPLPAGPECPPCMNRAFTWAKRCGTLLIVQGAEGRKYGAATASSSPPGSAEGCATASGSEDSGDSAGVSSAGGGQGGKSNLGSALAGRGRRGALGASQAGRGGGRQCLSAL